ncbi:rRNA maturation RNase YbeY [Frisingicoccus sp.]|uniref:rRNA maturation RNase YbeY n=1 Tax=Frisingicoccus sp. TaxID=1918627 RepID=UPI003734F916
MTAEEYRKYLETDFDDVDVNELKDIRKVRIDRSQTKEKRIAQYLKQVGNPYMVRVGNVKVKIRFANNGVSFEDAFEEMNDELPRLLGDIFISIDRTEEQAIDYGHSFERELGFLTVHGFLHLNGYDHQTEEEERAMFSLQEKILEENGLER